MFFVLLERCVLSDQVVAVLAIVLRHVQGWTAKRYQTTGPTPVRNKTIVKGFALIGLK
jgi:hypothetical protein